MTAEPIKLWASPSRTKEKIKAASLYANELSGYSQWPDAHVRDLTALCKNTLDLMSQQKERSR